MTRVHVESIISDKFSEKYLLIIEHGCIWETLYRFTFSHYFCAQYWNPKIGTCVIEHVIG